MWVSVFEGFLGQTTILEYSDPPLLNPFRSNDPWRTSSAHTVEVEQLGVSYIIMIEGSQSHDVGKYSDFTDFDIERLRKITPKEASKWIVVRWLPSKKRAHMDRFPLYEHSYLKSTSPDSKT